MKTFYIIRSDRFLYAICDSVGEAEEFKEHFSMPFDTWELRAKTRKQAMAIAIRDMQLKPSERIKKIYKLGEPA